MAVKLENVGIAVRDLEAAISFFTGHGRLELFEYIHPEAIETESTRPNEIGMHRVAFPSTTSTRR